MFILLTEHDEISLLVLKNIFLEEKFRIPTQPPSILHFFDLALYAPTVINVKFLSLSLNAFSVREVMRIKNMITQH